MGKFGCAQIRTSRSYSAGKKKDFLMCFLGLEYFAQRFNQPFDKMAKKDFPFSTPRKTILGSEEGASGDF